MIAYACMEYELSYVQQENIAIISQLDQAPVVQHNHVAAPSSRVWDDNVTTVNEVPTACWEHSPIAECNHVASSN